MTNVFVFNEIKKELASVEKFLEQYTDFSHSELKKSAHHTLKAGGKRIRPAFVLLAGKIYNQDKTYDLIPLAAAMELIHMSSLVHDDVIDQADIRRGKSTVRVLWGNKFSLHCGDYLLAQATKLIRPEENKEIANVLANMSVEMCQGEIRQLLSLFDTTQTIRNYFYRIKRKTALLIAASCKIGALATNAPKEAVNALYKYGYYIGMAFQIKDDCLDMQGSSSVIGKPAGSDLAQGIITLPTIFALRGKGEESRKLNSLIKSKFANGKEDLDRALDIVRNSGGIEKALSISNKYINKAKKQLQILPSGSIKNSLEQIADYITERDY
ncbi:MAG: heptaprenyl diphosphate synthase [Clostridia bacterium]|nr:heptaprenyl diphosphate synthase [Clostridia bacterium]